MKEPKFVARSGQVDYTNIRYAPVVNTVVSKGDEILLVKRSEHLRLYPGSWNGVSGFLDTNENIETKIYEELSEELGISKNQVESIKIGRVFVQEAPEYNKTWIVFPANATISTKRTRTNWENSHAKWFKLGQLKDLPLLPDFEKVLRQFFRI